MSLGADNKGGWVLQMPLETRTKDGKLLWQVWREAALPVARVDDDDARRRRPASRPPRPSAPLTRRERGGRQSRHGREPSGKLLGFSFPTDVIVLPTKTLASLMTPAMPLSLHVADAGADGHARRQVERPCSRRV